LGSFFIAQEDSFIDTLDNPGMVDTVVRECLLQVDQSVDEPSVSFATKISPHFDKELERNWDELTYVGFPVSPYKDSNPPLCRLLKTKKSVVEIVIQDASSFVNHILVIADGIIPTGLFHFAALLRAAYLSKEQSSDIIIVSSQIPDEKGWSFLGDFPCVYFLEADCSKDQELARLNLVDCQQILILSDIRDWHRYSQETAMADAKAV